MDDKLKQLLKELGDAINESISASAYVNDQIQKIRDEGYNLYVFLDATIGLNREEEETEAATSAVKQIPALPSGTREGEVQFRINFNDLTFLRGMGIDPTRKVKAPRRLEAKRSDTEQS
ncbi:MAG TPA: hypothetical protein VHL58_18020 [Thermoanaerobaculia bacterium]|nr:hypothetical protein [Thermoanaerobaculia bacterium]